LKESVSSSPLCIILHVEKYFSYIYSGEGTNLRAWKSPVALVTEGLGANIFFMHSGPTTIEIISWDLLK